MPDRPECPHKPTAHAPCVIEDGPICYDANANGDPVCTGCGHAPFHTGVAPLPGFKPIVEDAA